ncbi:recombinase family protein [Sphingomonas sp. MG17]|uniref:Recombinase family protein n=1 Tax=Sphingomonas tagetis TaxID=2949092 RepID=A0A9X2HRT5_9SPHN|nr:recombinase family protein [Sphingomonas tagetis]
MSAQRAITYARVSTARQGASGLGLEAQRAAVQAHAAATGMTIVAEYVEVESGKRDDRPQLAAALSACRLHRAVLLIAKLDRLSRSVRTVSTLMDSGVEFSCVDMPHANRLTLHLMAAMAEYERDMISARTKAALAAAKARGVKMGNPRGAAALGDSYRMGVANSAAARTRRAGEAALALAPIIAEVGADQDNAEVARRLNARGVPAPSGGVWRASQVRRVRLRCAEAAQCAA